MQESPLLNQKLRLVVSEPWELSDPSGAPGRDASIETIGTAGSGNGSDALLLKATPAITYRDSVHRLFVATPRQAGTPIASLLSDGRVEVNLHGIPGDTLPEDPLSLRWWRGGLGMVATLVLPKPERR